MAGEMAQEVPSTPIDSSPFFQENLEVYSVTVADRTHGGKVFIVIIGFEQKSLDSLLPTKDGETKEGQLTVNIKGLTQIAPQPGTPREMKMILHLNEREWSSLKTAINVGDKVKLEIKMGELTLNKIG
ncbi:hypothetical protein J4441_01450 [Candidatus Micrarchaeota archaeon]|nr:hypothetical protein [Candidatus Micrarchaeota archaeon]